MRRITEEKDQAIRSAQNNPEVLALQIELYVPLSFPFSLSCYDRISYFICSYRQEKNELNAALRVKLEEQDRENEKLISELNEADAIIQRMTLFSLPLSISIFLPILLPIIHLSFIYIYFLSRATGQNEALARANREIARLQKENEELRRASQSTSRAFFLLLLLAVFLNSCF